MRGVKIKEVLKYSALEARCVPGIFAGTRIQGRIITFEGDVLVTQAVRFTNIIQMRTHMHMNCECATH